ncbi:hypothetical protein [Saccharothrix sp. HUAS TT1]|uniref:hypothetical protein n=1 Tax=unclassified Saccharothrix TaxID=2593673 RepID=UPI00345C2671
MSTTTGTATRRRRVAPGPITRFVPRAAPVSDEEALRACACRCRTVRGTHTVGDCEDHRAGIIGR